MNALSFAEDVISSFKEIESSVLSLNLVDVGNVLHKLERVFHTCFPLEHLDCVATPFEAIFNLLKHYVEGQVQVNL